MIGLAMESVRTPGRVRFLWALAASGRWRWGFQSVHLRGGGRGARPGPPGAGQPVAAGDRPARGVRRGDCGDVRDPAEVGQFAAERERHAVDAGVLGGGIPAPFARAIPRLAGEGDTSQMFAYPAGGDLGASTLTTAMVVTAVVAYVRRGSKTVLALLIAPFAMGLAAAFAGRYPYGGSARTMQYVAPSIILMAGLGAAVLLARLARPNGRDRAPALVFCILAFVGIGMMAWDASHPYMTRLDLDGRDSPGGSGRRSRPAPSWSAPDGSPSTAQPAGLARRPRGGVPVPPGHLFAPASPEGAPAVRPGERSPTRSASWSSARPGATRRSSPVGSARMRGRYTLGSRRERVLNEGLRRGKALAEDRYVVYELVPAVS